jgi:2-methylisocitrate lyase-like PEP mutase family enzyme
MLAHIGEIVKATPLPVNADFLNGYADEPEDVAENVQLCIDSGVAGLSIEDNTGRTDAPLYEKNLAVERIRAARSAIDASGTGVVLTGRCEAWLVGDADPLRSALDRLAAYADAGADCLYAPGVSNPDEIAQIVRAIAPKPVNLLISIISFRFPRSPIWACVASRSAPGSPLRHGVYSYALRATFKQMVASRFSVKAPNRPS